MPETYRFDDLKIPAGSEFFRLMERCPDIEALRFADGEYLMREGEERTDIFLVLRGSFVVEHASPSAGTQERDALAIVTCTLDAPQFVGEMAYLGQGRRSASVRASMAVFTLSLKPADLDVILGEFPMLTRILFKEFTRRLKETSEALGTFQEGMRLQAEHFFAQPGQLIIERGQPADKLYQLVDGAVERIEAGQSSTVRGDELPFGFIDPGPFFADAKYEATVKADGPAMLVAIARQSKLAVIRRYPDILLSVYNKAAKRG